MPQCRKECRTRFSNPVDLVLHTEEECRDIASKQAGKDTELFRNVLKELEALSEGECVSCSRRDEENHTVRCPVGRAEKRAQRNSYIRRSIDTKLFKELKKLFGETVGHTLRCRSCGKSEVKLGLLHEPGCISVRIQNRIARFS